MKSLLRILIVDDSPDDASLIVHELKKEFKPVFERVDSAAALQAALAKESWDIVISDFIMPQFSGLAALKIVQEKRADMPFLIVSGNVGEDVAVEAMKAGAHDYLIKNNLTRLIPAVRREIKEAAVRWERRQAEDALYSSQTMFRSLVEQSLVGIYILQNGKFAYVNPKFAEIFGYSQNEIIASKFLVDLVADDCKSEVNEKLVNHLDTKAGSIHYSFQGVRKDGKQIELEAHGTKMEFNGKPAVIGTLLDITERKRTEEELRKLSRAVEHSPVSVVITDINGNTEYVNPKFTSVTGYAPEEVLGRTPRLLKSGEMDPREYNQLWKTITAGQEWHGEFLNRKKNGDLFWESASISAIKNVEGVITHFVAVKEDITERKKSIDQMRQAQKMEAIGQLAGGISHDFNNLLTIINGYSALLLRALDIRDPLRKEVEHILHAGERAAELTRQLLTFSRRQILEPKVLDINALVQNLEKMLCRLLGEQFKLNAKLDEGAGLVKADPGQVDQIIMNLVVNARDALENGGEITINTANVELDDNFVRMNAGSVPGSYVMLEVKDNGIGMSEEVRRRIFEPFFTTKEQGRGTGLGLATVYGIVKQSGGYILVASEPGQGSSFKVFLPRVYEERTEISKPGKEEQPAGKQTILVAEDEIGVLNLIVHTLSKHGYTVLHTVNPSEALEIFQQKGQDIDLLLTDVVMPFMGGPKLAETLQKMKPNLKVIFMSGHTADTVGLQNILERGYSFIAKPFVNGTLVEKIGQVLGNQESHDSAVNGN
ncbi:MAG: multi-sensor hybrid histidine [Geobacteraceae bacterium]|nr:MAG: multi-sensor hybrid histidine [Geobacteraceae bacterium]